MKRPMKPVRLNAAIGSLGAWFFFPPQKETRRKQTAAIRWRPCRPKPAGSPQSRHPHSLWRAARVKRDQQANVSRRTRVTAAPSLGVGPTHRPRMVRGRLKRAAQAGLCAAARTVGLRQAAPHYGR